MSTFLLISLLINLSGVSNVNHSGDSFCTDTCEAYINFTSTYWEFCFERGGEKDLVYRKTTSPRLWINMDKVEFLVPTNPQVPVTLQVPTFGNKWRDIKEGDCLKRTTKSNPLPIRLKIIGTKEVGQTIKWGFNLNHWSSEGVYIDPIWFGVNITPLKDCSQIQTERTLVFDYDYVTRQRVTYGICESNGTRNCINGTEDYQSYEVVNNHYDYINTTLCTTEGFKIGKYTLNYSKCNINCGRDGKIFQCVDCNDGGGAGCENYIVYSGQSGVVIDLTDSSWKEQLQQFRADTSSMKQRLKECVEIEN